MRDPRDDALSDRTKTEVEDSDASRRAGRVLAFWDGGSASRALPTEGTLVFGRSQDCDVAIDHASVSRRHAALHVGNGSLAIEDLGSSNGTRLNGERIPARVPTPLPAAAVLEIGGARVLVEHPTRRVAAAPAAAQANAVGGEDDADDDALTARDEAMIAVYRLLELVAPSHLNVLVLGETGVGKELAARAVHDRSPRAGKPLMRINCAALPDTLLESELFGHEKGAFTGALAAKRGLLEAAEGGTVFLDEVAELPKSAQAKLLRAIESREITRLGALAPRSIDVRFVAATHADLPARVASGEFRQDLYFRLNGASVTIPPLRDRPSEIAPLAAFFAARTARAMNRAVPAFSDAATRALLAYAWPGNIRELRNVVERAVVVCGSAVVDVQHLPPEVVGVAQPPSVEPSAQATTIPAPAGALRGELDALERKRIVHALEQAAGHQGRAAELLGISRRTLLSRLDAHGLPRPRKGRAPAKR